MKRTTIIETIVFLYAILFLYTGISKLIDLGAFKESITNSQILAPIATPIAWGLPWLEFAITLLLIIPRWRLKGLYFSLLLMIIFTVYVILILIIDEHLPCSCGGIIQELTWPQHILFNTTFIILSIAAIILQKREKKALYLNLNVNNYPLFPKSEHIIK